MATPGKQFNSDPFRQYSEWFFNRPLQTVAEPYAATLATSSGDGRVSARIVLVKSYDNKGFLIFTNYRSRKAHDLSENPFCSLLFYWPESKKQIRIQGVAEKITEKESADYFRSRLYESQLSAWASEQSSIIESRDWLEQQYQVYKTRFGDKPVEKPPHWGGYRIVPEMFEFWEEGSYRLHHRTVYEKNDDSWVIRLLAP